MPAGRKERKIMKIYYQHPNTWFGDCMPFGKDDTFYLFHQRDTRVPCPFGEPFGWDLATTKDFVTLPEVSAKTEKENIMHSTPVTTEIIQNRENHLRY